MLAAISRTVRSASARREISSRDRPSSSISRAFWIATTAWSANASISAASSSSYASRRVASDLDHAEQPVVGEERRGDGRVQAHAPNELVGLGDVVEPVVGQVVAGHDGAPAADRQAVDPAIRRDALAGHETGRAGPAVARTRGSGG